MREHEVTIEVLPRGDRVQLTMRQDNGVVIDLWMGPDRALKVCDQIKKAVRYVRGKDNDPWDDPVGQQ